MRGRFITFEGGEGAGKSTQARLLAQALRDAGAEAVLTREPGGSDGAELVRDLLLGGPPGRWEPQAEALLFAAARSDHVARVIAPALDRGAWVISDRYLDSSRAYQGDDAVTDEALLSLHRFGSGGLMPDRTLLLSIPAAAGMARAAERDRGTADRFSGRDLAFHQRVGAAFDRLATQEPDRIRRIDAGRAAATVAQDVRAALSDLWPA